MFSETYTIADVKIKLSNGYAYYSFSTDGEFETALESASNDVMYLYFYPRIGDEAYDDIADKDRVSLTEYETYLYWAEVYTICYEFLLWHQAISNQSQDSNSESLTVEGYSYKQSSSSGVNSNSSSLSMYRSKMYEYFKLAGFNLSALERTCTIFGDSRIVKADLED